MEDFDVSQKLDEIKIIRDKYYAGKASIEKDDVLPVLQELSDYLSKTVNKNYLENFPELIPLLVEIFTASFSGNLAKPFAEVLQPESYFQYGEYILQLNEKVDDEYSKSISELIGEYLNVLRLSPFLKKIYNDNKWDNLIKDLIVESNFTVNALFRQRLTNYKSKTLFSVIKGNHSNEFTWEETAEKVSYYGKSILSYFSSQNITDGKVAFLLDNSINMALLDLACLTHGVVNVMIPANAVPQHVSLILNETEVELLFVSDEKQLSKVKSIKKELINLRQVILLEGSSSEEWVSNFDKFINQYKHELDEQTTQKLNSFATDSLATIMYTSGTTGEPKGIMFSHLNIVYKRFCRALALPEIGDEDVFLSFLPLFHTFGRYLEMMGSVFWGAEYVFMENPSVETMISNMKFKQPTVFISIPKKWIQLYEAITSLVDIEIDPEEKIVEAIKQVTGGELRWGLSAAGYLSPDIFRFFQKYGVELMSGFGMTEATGGITMTPPDNYIENSLGKALPGISIKLANDGELLIKGAYVMMGYYGQEYEDTFVDDGWLPTGDVMQMDENNYIEIVDRKKEIYKNIKGETIAPQKIENLFRDFEYVKQVFLVGDHLPFNTVLIFPNYDTEDKILDNMNESQLQEYFSSVVVTVNNFLAPFERILDFRIIDRPFSEENNELTPKGTFKRRNIEQNFADVIKQMYQKNYITVEVDDINIRIPNWFLREKGCLSRDIQAGENKLTIQKLDLALTVKNKGNNLVQLGDFNYQINDRYLDFQSFLINPLYWLGNYDFFNFTGESIIRWYRSNAKSEKIIFYSRTQSLSISGETRNHLEKIYSSKERSVMGLFYAILLLQSGDEKDGLQAVEYIDFVMEEETLPTFSIASQLLYRPILSDFTSIRRIMFGIMIKYQKPGEFELLLTTYLKQNYDLINEKVIQDINNYGRDLEVINTIENLIEKEIENLPEKEFDKTALPSLFDTLSEFGSAHPQSYKTIRQVLVGIQINGKNENIRKSAKDFLLKLEISFRDWLGYNQSVAIDPETGDEYKWNDVITFDEAVGQDDKERIIKAISTLPLIREAIFLFSGGLLLRLNTILPGGIWISHLGSYHDKSVYRVSIQTRLQGAFDVALNLNKGLPAEKVQEEVNWLIMAGSQISGQTLSESFGGYWKECDLWSEEFVPGDTVEKFLLRNSKKKDEAVNERTTHLWPFFVWNAATAYWNFWKMTNYKLVLADPSTKNINIPSHDYQTGTRLVSLSNRKELTDVFDFFLLFTNQFIISTEEEYPFLKKKNIWNYIFSGIINAEGEERGLDVLEEFNERLKGNGSFPNKEIVKDRLEEFIANVKQDGFLGKRLFFAIKRFHRWIKLNPDASLQAQGEMLYELYETYRLADLENEYPETRSKFFLETAFIDSSNELRNTLSKIVFQQHTNELTKDGLLEELSIIKSEFELNEKEDFFLTRMSYPHLKPTDSAELINLKSGSTSKANLVVQYEDYEGNPFIIRHPVTPKEISKLHQLFLEANLLVSFKPEHEYLVAISERGYIVGGLFYIHVDEQTIYMDKIVVSNRYRRLGLSDKLMTELFTRAKSRNYKNVRTGFFRPEYFYKFGFKIEKKYSGLVKELE